jgi:multidrug efflux pump
VSSGTIGDLPNLSGQGIAATVVVSGQLSLPSSSSATSCCAPTPMAPPCACKDVARIELGARAYATAARLNGKPPWASACSCRPVATRWPPPRPCAPHGRAARYFPQGMKWSIPYDSSRFVDISITQVAKTLLEAVALVFLVMFLFLQNWRYTIIPTIVVPVALLGTFATLLALGFSINVLTMFGMVLVIGIVVDDAIVVVENVERIMSEEGLPPLEATRKAMGQISGAIIGVTVVLISVFVPLAFFAGSVGNIYRQFSAVMVASIGFSAFMALSLTPALCATLLKPVEAGHHHEKTGFFGWFNRSFAARPRAMRAGGPHAQARGRYLDLRSHRRCCGRGVHAPAHVVPAQRRPGQHARQRAAAARRHARAHAAVMEQVEAFMLKQPEVQSMVGVLGFSFSGQGQNAALAFVTLKDWSERHGPGQSAQAVAGARLARCPAFAMPSSSP